MGSIVGSENDMEGSEVQVCCQSQPAANIVLHLMAVVYIVEL